MDEDKTVTEDNIRYTLGAIDNGTVKTDPGFNNDLKRDDPVVIIHRDDFMSLIYNGYPGLWLKVNNVKEIMGKW